MKIVLESEESGNSQSLFRLEIDGAILGRGLTAARAHVMIGDALEQELLTKGQDAQHLSSPGGATVFISRSTMKS